MITLIHGDDIAASRNFYYDTKKQSAQQLTLDGVTLTTTDLQQALTGDDLFGTRKDIFIENLVSKRKSPKEIEVLANLITDSSSNIVLWESKELTKKQIEQFGRATVRLFKIPATIFALLDALKPNNGKQLVELFHKTLAEKDAEFVLVMLQRQIRILLSLFATVIANEVKQPHINNEIAASQAPRNDVFISEIARLSWQKSKLEKQAKQFTAQQLIDFHTSLFNLEKNMKTGRLTLPLEKSIDLLLLSL